MQLWFLRFKNTVKFDSIESGRERVGESGRERERVGETGREWEKVLECARKC